MAPSPDEVRGPRGPFTLAVLALAALIVFAGFIALGTWQVQRRAWKLDLIARVDQRVHAPASAAPNPDQWPQITAADEYRHVRLTGVFLYDRQTLVAASTVWGSGYWVLTPLRMDDGSFVLVNRGFVSPDGCIRTTPCAPDSSHEISISGLLRTSETHAFMRQNDPVHERWYTRDVQAIAAIRALTPVAPYFVDAGAIPGATENPAIQPVGGLTVITFPNNHLAYLITWYLLALMVAIGATYVGLHEYRLRRSVRTTATVSRQTNR